MQALGDFCCTPHVFFEQQMKVGRGRSKNQYLICSCAVHHTLHSTHCHAFLELTPKINDS